MCLLQLRAAEILELFVVQRELRWRRIRESRALMSRIATEGRVARGHGPLISCPRKADAQCVDERPVVSAAPGVDRLLVPITRKIDLEANRLCLGVDRLDCTVDLAVLPVRVIRGGQTGGLDARAARGQPDSGSG